MTKPVTSVAAMLLYEEGLFSLNDPIADHLPAFADARVYVAGMGTNLATRPAVEPVRIWHLLTHTAGMTYGAFHTHPIHAAYCAAGLESGPPPGMDLAAVCDRYAGLPLQFEPGTAWNYGVGTDVIARLIEVLSGMPFDEFVAERLFRPLGMDDAGFFVGSERTDRLAVVYRPDANGRATPLPGAPPLTRPDCVSAGGGLVASALDYYRFTEMLRRGGELDGIRLLGPRTVELMVTNHLPDCGDLRTLSPPELDPGVYGFGFGLGFQVTVDPITAKVPSRVGEYGWVGKASTFFWVDPQEELTVLFLTQLQPQTAHPILPQLKQLVYQAIVS